LLAENADGSGLMYRRNRYYDPTSGKFTQEDPIGIAGGLNVYGYANGDPVTYSDPFGLCPDPKDPACNDFVSKLTVGFTLGIKDGVQVGNLEGEVSAGATGEAGIKQTADIVSRLPTNSGVWSARAGVGLKLRAFGHGPDMFKGVQAGERRDDIKSVPVEGDGTVAITATIPLFGSPLGVQFTYKLNIPAAVKQLTKLPVLLTTGP